MPKKRIKTIAEEHEVTVDEIVKLIETKLPEHTITGTGYARWINEEGQELLAEAVDIPELMSKRYRGTVHSEAPNRSYVYVYINEIKKKVPMVIPRRYEGRLTKGKRVKVEGIEDRQGISYRYVR
tara:strand:- start:131 stop:505 length:375 start_codon:yes stop_codon:yes gene_type:complete